jgi:hypothetical protein
MSSLIFFVTWVTNISTVTTGEQARSVLFWTLPLFFYTTSVRKIFLFDKNLARCALKNV